MIRTRRLSLLLALAASAPLAAPAQDAGATADPAVFSVEKILDYETVSDPQVSPDGRSVVYTRRRVDPQEDRWESALWIMNADGSRNRFLTEGSSPTWSPDGRRLAYLARGEPSGSQIWVRWVDEDGPATQVTRLTESPANLRWSPDGSTIGFTRFVPKPESWKIDLPAPPKGAKWTEPPRIVDRLHYRQDYRGFTQTGFVHLFTVPAEGGMARQVTRGDWNLGYRFDQMAGGVDWEWTPDGRSVVVEGLDDPRADLTYRDSYIYRVDVASGTKHRLTPERGSWSAPAVSPDGRWIAFVGYPYTPQTYRTSDLFVMRTDGSELRMLSEGFDRSPNELTWAPNGSGVYFTAEDRGSRNVHFAPLRGGVRRITEGAQMLSLASLSRSGAAFGVRTDPHRPTDVVRIDLRRGALTQLTRVNDDLLERVRLGEVEEIWYTSTGGARIQGWIVKPPSFDPSRKYPLILEIHGGPHAMYNVGFSPMHQNFAANGYVVLYTNPRGSTGYGTEFGNAINYAYPSVDHEDLMTGVDSVVNRGYIDEGRTFVGGCSGGGVLSSWAIGHTDRFEAAAVRCPVTNWLSFIGQTDVPLFTGNFFEKPFWEDPEPWLRQSPLMYVGNVTTPTLLMTGELDLRTPMAQTEEYYAALKLRGVPSRLLRFQGEYHGTGTKPSNWMRTQLYMMDWYRQWGGKTPEERMRDARPAD